MKFRRRGITHKNRMKQNGFSEKKLLFIIRLMAKRYELLGLKPRKYATFYAHANLKYRRNGKMCAYYLTDITWIQLVLVEVMLKIFL